MDRQQLQQKLEQLHTELRQVESVDQGERRVLRQLSADIQELLDQGGEHAERKYDRLSERLRDGVKHLEASHPKVTLLMGQLIDTLERMGI